MEYKLSEKIKIQYIEGVAGKTFINSEQDILDFIVFCGYHDTNRIMLHEENLSEDFFDLKTQLAGKIMQKLSNYRIKGAAVISGKRIKGRFGEMVLESKKFGDMRFFTDKNEAEIWLVKN